MIDLNKLDIEHLTQIALLSNTPNYFFSNFYEDASIELISELYNTEELISSFNEILEKKNKTLEDFVHLYGILFALFHKPYQEIEGFLGHLDEISVTWLNYFINYYNIYLNRPLSTATIDYKPRPPIISIQTYVKGNG